MTVKELKAKSLVMPLLGVGDSNFPVEVAVELACKTIIEFHATDSEQSKDPQLKRWWGQPSQLESITIVIWRKPGDDDNVAKNPTIRHFEQVREKFDFICGQYGLQATQRSD